MQSIRSLVFYHLLRRQLRTSRRLNQTIASIRASGESSSGKLGKMPKGVESHAVTIQGLRAEWLLPMDRRESAIVLYLHGGAYITGSIVTHRRLAAKLAVAASASTLILDYKLAPENPYPAAVDDALKCYVALRTSQPNARIAVAGDSAGGGLALALCLRLRDEGLDPPVAMALLSPWTDLTLSNETHLTRAAVDPFFPDKSGLHGAAALYAGSNDLKDPYISPQFANLAGLAPTLIHVGSLEALLDDSRVLARRMAEHGTQVTIKTFTDMWHVWQAFAGLFPEASQSVKELGAFLDRHLSQS